MLKRFLRNCSVPVVYESAQTRKFQLGRTEVIRSTSNEGKEWVLSMLDPKASVCSPFHFLGLFALLNLATRVTRDSPLAT